MTAYSDIVKRIKEAVPEAASTANHPEAKGRPDTVFNRLILEYKKPGVIKENNEKNRQLITQVKGYIEDLSKEERWKEERLLGVAFERKRMSQTWLIGGSS